jgi:glutamyl-tRNA synthetase
LRTDIEYTTKIVSLLKERAVFVDDLWNLGSYFFQAPKSFDEKAAKKVWKEDTPAIIDELIKKVSETEPFTAENLQQNVKGWITSNNIGFGKVMQPLRLSLVGEMQGPDVFDIAALIGKLETVQRLEYAQKNLV